MTKSFATLSSPQALVKTGYASLSRSALPLKLSGFRSLIEAEYNAQDYPRDVHLHHVRDSELAYKLMDLITSREVIDFLQSLSAEIGEPVYLFPMATLMRNYFSSPAHPLGLHGWHYDSGGELRNPNCYSYLQSPSYFCGKLQFSFQFQTPYGGNIDVIPSSLFRTSSQVPFHIRAFLRIQSLLDRLPAFRSLTLGSHYLSDLPSYLLGIKTTNPQPLTPTFFDSRLLHRGTPLRPSTYRTLSLKSLRAQAISDYALSPRINMGENNKYMLYIQYGTRTAIKSYYIDRLNRDDREAAITNHLQQLAFLCHECSHFESAQDIFSDFC